MKKEKIDIQKFMESGDPTDIFIRLTSAIVLSQEIDPNEKMDALERIIESYEKITEKNERWA